MNIINALWATGLVLLMVFFVAAWRQSQIRELRRENAWLIRCLERTEARALPPNVIDISDPQASSRRRHPSALGPRR